jgi:hypothetical protein
MSDHSQRPNKITPRLFALFLGCALAGSTAAVMTFAARADGPDAEAVTIDTTFTVKTPPVRLDKPAHDARASVVLMTGGNGLLNLDASRQPCVLRTDTLLRCIIFSGRMSESGHNPPPTIVTSGGGTCFDSGRRSSPPQRYQSPHAASAASAATGSALSR